MYENQTWLPVASMFGLIGCAIPRVLKSEIFLTLAEFARSPEIAATMWQTLENSQVNELMYECTCICLESVYLNLES